MVWRFGVSEVSPPQWCSQLLLWAPQHNKAAAVRQSCILEIRVQHCIPSFSVVYNSVHCTVEWVLSSDVGNVRTGYLPLTGPRLLHLGRIGKKKKKKCIKYKVTIRLSINIDEALRHYNMYGSYSQHTEEI